MKKSLFNVRFEAGFKTQQELADAAGVNKTMVWMGENPSYHRPLGSKSAFLILRALRESGVDLTVDDLDWKVSGHE